MYDFLYSQKARAKNLKELSEIITFLQENGITDAESLEAFISERRSLVDEKKTRLDNQTTEMKDLQKLPDAKHLPNSRSTINQQG